MMQSKREIMNILANSTGTTAYHRFSPLSGYPVATDGIIAIAEAAECFWLLDAIGSHQSDKKLDPAFQVWKLEVSRDNDSAVLRGYNDETLIVEQKIPNTDFPLDEIKMYLIRGVILLPSEY